MRPIPALAFSALIALSVSPGAAQAPVRADVVADIKQCKQIAAAEARLTCLERATDALIAAVDGGDVRLVDREARAKQRRGLFGFSLPDIFGSGDGKPDDPEMAEMQTLVSTITEVRQLDRKTYVMRIAEANALWRIDEAPSRFILPKVGETVEFKKAAMNSYFIRVGKQVGVKGKRIG